MAETASLKYEIEKAAQAFNRWADGKIEWLESSNIVFEKTISEVANTINALNDEEKQLEAARAQNDAVKEKQRLEMERYSDILERLKSQQESLGEQLEQCSIEEHRESGRYDRLRREYEEYCKVREKAMNDMTRGIRLYMALGLEFQKTSGESMKFVFTQIDPTQPNRQFYFLMHVDSEDRYKLEETFPRLEPLLCERLVNQLNTDNDIRSFVVRMRLAFCKLVR